MKNKVNLKKCLWQCVAVGILFLLLGIGLQWKAYRMYTENYNKAVYAIVKTIREKVPEVEEAELMEILNEDSLDEEGLEEFAERYGMDSQTDSILRENDKAFWMAEVVGGLLVVGMGTFLVIVFLQYNRKKDQELSKITHYIEEINQRNYKLDIDSISEDELSILKNEIYKTTVMLKEVAEHSVKAKNDLKDALSDISHQLKTPLTSISIILDNLIDDLEMPQEIRQGFIRDVKREIANINFLVQSLLKLSKLDSNTVAFIKEEVVINKIVEMAVQNVAALCDLKNVEIEVQNVDTENHIIVCDLRWQVEAITNILKNSVEHSPDGGRVLIKIEKNKIYSSISIQDFGPGIDEEDQKHIFERFYKGKNASSDSVGIGLALAKAIIEADQGHISVESGKNETSFLVKYFHLGTELKS